MSTKHDAEALGEALTWVIAVLVFSGGLIIAVLPYRTGRPASRIPDAPAVAQAAYACDSRFYIEQHKLETSGMGYSGSQFVYVVTDKLTGRSYLSIYNMRLTEIQPPNAESKE